MRTLRYLVLALLFLLLLIIVIGFLLPAKVRLERSIEINRDQQTIFQVINSLSNFNDWSPWFEKDPDAQYNFSGNPSGVGSKLSWQGNKNVGSGSNEIIESELNQFVKTEMYFGKDDHPAYATISLKPNNNSVVVTWAFENDFGYNVFYRYFGLVLEDMIAPDYEKGLANLKKHMESLPLYDYSGLSIVNTSAEKIYTYESIVDIQQEEISTAIGAAYAKILVFTNNNSIKILGTPKIISLDFSNNKYQFIAALPVENNEIIDENNEIMATSMYSGKAIKLIHKGSYNKFKQSYDVLFAYLSQNEIEKNGNPWEDFVTDPGNVSEANLITHIYQPIK